MKFFTALVVVPGALAISFAPLAGADTATYLHCLKADEIDGFPLDDATLVKIGIEANHAMGGVQRPDTVEPEIQVLMQKYNLSYHQGSSVAQCATGAPPTGV